MPAMFFPIFFCSIVVVTPTNWKWLPVEHCQKCLSRFALFGQKKIMEINRVGKNNSAYYVAAMFFPIFSCSIVN